MITRELLGRALGALACMSESDAGYVVLRDLAREIDAVMPTSNVHLLTVAESGPPRLLFISGDVVVDLGRVPVEVLQQSWGRLDLRFMQALLGHALETVQVTLNPPPVRDAKEEVQGCV